VKSERGEYQMNIAELVGKKAIRTKPMQIREKEEIMAFTGMRLPKYDYSYTTEPIEILKVTDNHIVYKSNHFEGKFLLDNRWIDNNWEDYSKLLKTDNNCGVSDEIIQEINDLDKDVD
jgi:hypothetical protein